MPAVSMRLMKTITLLLTALGLVVAQPASRPRDPNLPAQVSMIMLGVQNLARSVEFYQTVLELRLNSQSGEFAFFSAGNITLALSTPLGNGSKLQTDSIEIIFPVESVAKAHTLLTQRGCKFINQPREVSEGSWAASFTDPDGHRLTLLGRR
jgi:predicted enzyme related to lactoylglutathione lyase